MAQGDTLLLDYGKTAKTPTSLGVSWWHRLLFHHNSRAATRQARRRPMAKMQKTPAKLCSLRDLPSVWALEWLVRSQRPVCGHHFCLSTSRSPVSCSSRILQDITQVSRSHGLHQLCHPVPSLACYACSRAVIVTLRVRLFHSVLCTRTAHRVFVLEHLMICFASPT